MEKKYIFINDETKEKNLKLKISDILLSPNNPRFTLINSFDEDLISFLKENKLNLEQNEILIKLFSLEGDFFDFFTLLNSINSNGFNNSTEPIFIIENNNDKNYLVAEGNRRIMALKLIFDNFEIPKYEDIYYQTLLYQNTNSDFLEEEILSGKQESNSILKDSDNYEKQKKYYDECVKIIKEIKQNATLEFIIYFKIIKDSDTLWKIIYDKHLTGEKPGLRKWSRTKYYADLLKIFEDGFLSDDKRIDKICWKINRNKKFIEKDFKEAQYIYSCVYFGENLNDDERVVFNDERVLEKMITLIKPSSLEKIHSFNKIKTLICEEWLEIDKETFDKNYINIYFNTYDKRIKFVKGNKIKKISKFINFIYNEWKKGTITTRPFRDKNYLINELKILLEENYDINKKLTIEQLNNLNEFEYSIENLEKIILSNKIFYDEKILKRFKLAISLKKYNNKASYLLKSLFNDIENRPKDIFFILKKQLDHNLQDNKKTFLNAVATTLRSIIEQLLVWMNWMSISDNEKEEYIENMCNGKITSLVRDKIRKNNNINASEIQKWIDFFFVNNGENFSEKTKEFLINITDSDMNSNELENLNSFVHSSHKMYLKLGFENRIETLNNIYDNIIVILENIDIKKLEEFDEKIFERLNKKST
ncbi:MAG: hypothetical protein ACRCRZ_01175 [Metamycoplasmataceae bacterium]